MRFLVLIFVAVLPLAAEAPDWKSFEFLLGEWTGVAADKDSQLGPGGGGCSFELDLNRNIILRKNTANYTSGVRHSDFMVIYTEGDPRAIYFDTEGHVIHYKITTPAANRAIFESDAAQAGPRYRLTYWTDEAVLKVKFEVAPPGGEYKTYTGGDLRRDTAH